MTEGANLFARALEELARGDTAGGITDLKAHLEREPDDAAAWLSLGLAYQAVQHKIQAADALKAAVDLDGDDVEARLAYARSLVLLGKLDLAAFQLVQAEKLEPEDARVAKELGVVFYDKKLFEKAADRLARAAKLAPGDARAAYALGLAHEGRRDPAGAVAAYREAVRRDPALVDAHRTLADALAAMGEHEEAIEELDRVLALEPTNEAAAKNREVLERALGEMKSHRLLGRTARELEASALVELGAMKNKGEVTGVSPLKTVRYAVPLVELYASFDEGGAIDALLLVLPDPARAAKAEDETFRVTVVAEDGTKRAADLGTGATLTFLREALGCPMTTASALYARLLGGEEALEWAGARVEFGSVERERGGGRHGVRVARVRAGAG